MSVLRAFFAVSFVVLTPFLVDAGGVELALGSSSLKSGQAWGLLGGGLIFADGFESGSSCLWSESETPEICNGADDNCDGSVDEDAIDALAWYEDHDGDTYGNSAVTVDACTAPLDWVDNGDDCDDLNPNINPGEPELCDSIDNNCNQQTDEGNPGGGQACDTGNAGVCSAGTTTCQSGTLVCVQDQASTPEVCDGLDNDCDGAPDNGDLCGGSQICVAGACQCDIGFTNCFGQCVDTSSDPNNCGTCGNMCPGGQSCVFGSCE